MRRCLVMAALACSAAAIAQPVAPGEPFRWQQLDVRAPESPGWVRIGQGANTLAFMRRSDELARSEVAIASVFALPDGLDTAGFAAWVDAAVRAESPPSRFRPISAESVVVEDRGYTCVSHRSRSHDLQARGVTAGSEPPLLEQHGLYCRHPGRRGGGFSASFSTRGPGADDTAAGRARAFIDGVVAIGGTPN